MFSRLSPVKPDVAPEESVADKSITLPTMPAFSADATATAMSAAESVVEYAIGIAPATVTPSPAPATGPNEVSSNSNRIVLRPSKIENPCPSRIEAPSGNVIDKPADNCALVSNARNRSSNAAELGITYSLASRISNVYAAVSGPPAGSSGSGKANRWSAMNV